MCVHRHAFRLGETGVRIDRDDQVNMLRVVFGLCGMGFLEMCSFRGTEMLFPATLTGFTV